MAVECFVFLGRKVILSRETYNYDEIQDPPGETRQNSDGLLQRSI